MHGINGIREMKGLGAINDAYDKPKKVKPEPYADEPKAVKPKR